MTRKSFISLFMVIAMVVSFAVPAFASTEGYTVTVNYDSTKGQVSVGYPSGKSSAAEGDTVRINTDANSGYELESIDAGDTNITLTPVTGSEGDYTFTMPASNVTINVEFAEPEYAYTLSLDYDSLYGDIWLEDGREGANQGDTVKVYYRCEEGYTVDSVKARYGTKSATVYEGTLDYYYFTMPAANVTV